MSGIIEEFLERGLIAESTDLEAIKNDFAAGPVTFYIGFDPTAQSLHIGNLLQLITMRRLQLAGNNPILLVGGATGLIGDPKQAGERSMNPTEVVAQWTEGIAQQASAFLDFDGPNAAILVNNYEWSKDMNVMQYLRDIGKHFSINRMLAREVVSSRLESGISYTEFSYVLLQSMDYLELFRRHNCVLQIGATDQWGNITAGVELIRRAATGRAHAIVTPLITRADGTKFGKSEGGAIWIDPKLTSPWEFYQFWINAEDAKVGEYLKLMTFLSVAQIDELMVEHEANPGARLAQRKLAGELTTFVHGVNETSAIELAAQALFGRGELAELSAGTLDASLREAGGVDAAAPITIIDALIATGLVDSKGAARRAIADGGVYVNNERVSDDEMSLTTGQTLADGWVVLRKGKRTISGIKLS